MFIIRNRFEAVNDMNYRTNKGQLEVNLDYIRLANCMNEKYSQIQETMIKRTMSMFLDLG